MTTALLRFFLPDGKPLSVRRQYQKIRNWPGYYCLAMLRSIYLILLIFSVQEGVIQQHYCHVDAFVIQRPAGQRRLLNAPYAATGISKKNNSFEWRTSPWCPKWQSSMTSTSLYDSEITTDPQQQDSAQTITTMAAPPLLQNTALPLNGHHHAADNTTTAPNGISISTDNEEDVPRPTANGGYTHTNASRAKISAANKGKTPWNKGRARSEEERARIAAGVRARNRENLLKKLKEMGMTEEEYEAKKKEDRRKREAERRARKTANGGFRPTEETKAKISNALKEKYKNGEIKRRKVDPSKVRRGYTHSEETRRKISESLKKKWKTDEEYRETMMKSYAAASTKQETRRKISETLKKRWSDPDFRQSMMKKMKPGRVDYESKSYRQKISDAMKRKWQEPGYRSKALSSIKKSAQNRTSTTSSSTTTRKRKTETVKRKKKVDSDVVMPMKPLTQQDLERRKKEKKKVKKKRPKQAVKKESLGAVSSVSKPRNKLKGSTPKVSSTIAEDTRIKLPEQEIIKKEKERKKKKKKKGTEKDGSVSRLKEERRDLFDLLYGDEDSLLDDELMDGDEAPSTLSKMGIIFGDEDLDAFDPYGLDDY